MSTHEPFTNAETPEVPEMIGAPEMAGTPEHPEQLRNIAIERILRADDHLEPSPGFSLRVMAAVRREAATPAPIPFPWRRFVAGIAVCGALIAAGAVTLARSAAELPQPAPSWPAPALSGSALAAATGLGWTLAALAGAYCLTWFADRLMRT